ncbi:MAG: NusG domain II-containing protein [Oscillospiraceae bacterium]|nr:NusG domain II-containing protein [Oscillospiraceae bacterium]
MKNQDLSRRFKLWEGIVIAAVIAAAAGGYFFIGRSDNGGTAVIKADGAVVKTLPLSIDTVYRPVGYDMEFTVSDGKICVSHSDCHDRVCMHTGYISGSFQSIVCLPNKITVTIESGGGDIDVVL